MISLLMTAALAAQVAASASAAARDTILAEARQVESSFAPTNLRTVQSASAHLLALSRSAARLGDRTLANELKAKACYVQLIARDESWVRFALLDVIKDTGSTDAVREAARNMLAFMNRPRDDRSGNRSFGVANFGNAYPLLVVNEPGRIAFR